MPKETFTSEHLALEDIVEAVMEDADVQSALESYLRGTLSKEEFFNQIDLAWDHALTVLTDRKNEEPEEDPYEKGWSA